MKILPNEHKPIRAKRRRERPTNSDSIEARCRRDGVKVHPSVIRQRMRDYDLTYEESVRYKPMEKAACGKKGKKGSYWAKATPGSRLEHRLTTGDIRGGSDDGKA